MYFGKSINDTDIKRLSYYVRVFSLDTLTLSLYSDLFWFKTYFAVRIGIYDPKTKKWVDKSKPTTVSVKVTIK